MKAQRYKTVLYVLLVAALCSCAAPPTLTSLESEQSDLSCSYFYFLWGSHAEFSGEFPAAFEAYEKALICDPSALYVKEKLPTLLLKMGELEKATAWLTAAITEAPANTQYKLLLATLYMQEDNTEKAIQLYQDILKNEPDNENVTLQLAILYIHQKDYLKAESLLTGILHTNAASYYPLLFLARVQKQLEKINESLATYEKVLNLNWSADIAYELGYLYVSQNKYEDGLRIFTTITDNDQYDEKAALTRIQTLLDLKLNDIALEGLRNTRMFSKNPDKIDLVISKVLLRQEQIEDAREILERLTRESDLSEPLYMLALLDFQMGNYESSLNYLRPITMESAEFEEAVYLQTQIYKLTGESEKAAAMLKEYISDSDSRSPLFYALLSSIHQERGDWEAALTLMKEATQIYPENYQLIYEYGILLEQSDRRAEAILQMEKVVEINSDHADALNYLGYSWAEQNENLQLALQYILRAADLKPNNGYIIDSLGWVYFRLGEYEKALHWLTKALHLKPDDANIYEHLGDTYRALNQNDKALDAYQKALQMYDEKQKKQAIEKKIGDVQ